MFIAIIAIVGMKHEMAGATGYGIAREKKTAESKRHQSNIITRHDMTKAKVEGTMLQQE